MISLYTKFDVPSFIHCKYGKVLVDVICYLFSATSITNVCTKFEEVWVYHRQRSSAALL